MLAVMAVVSSNMPLSIFDNACSKHTPYAVLTATTGLCTIWNGQESLRC